MYDAKAEGQPVLRLEDFLPYRLSVLSNQVSNNLACLYKERFGISNTEWRIMAVLGEYPGSSADEVSSKTKTEKSILSRAIQKLIQKNLVHRTMDAGDRRRSVLTLSDSGLAAYQHIVPLSYALEAQLKQCLDDREWAQLDRLLTKLYEQALKQG